MARLIDLTGQRFGRWTVSGRGPNSCGGRHPMWMCKCDCGKEASVKSQNLRDGTSKSCGCLARERLIMRSRTHGKTDTPEYYVWRTMKARCLNPKCAMFPHYGARGIEVCERWLNSFENFFADMGARPTAKHSIERSNNNGNYEPGNCYWATIEAQQNNKRRNVFVEFNGRTQTATQWARELGIDSKSLLGRLKRGSSFEHAIAGLCASRWHP